MRQHHIVFATLVLFMPAAVYAQQTSREPPHVTASGPAMPVPNANANPGVVDPNTQSNNNTASDRSNAAPTVASKYQNQAEDKVKSKRHKPISAKQSSPPDQR